MPTNSGGTDGRVGPISTDAAGNSIVSVTYPAKPGPPPQTEHTDEYVLTDGSPLLRRLELAKAGDDLVTTAVNAQGQPTKVTAQ